MTAEDFITAARSLGVVVDDAALERFERYHAALERANESTNLTRITGRDEVFGKHFLDSLACLTVLEDDSAGAGLSLVDVGTGAGLPGIAIGIVRPTWNVTLVEAARRKAAFLRDVASELGLDRVTVVESRAEEVGRDSDHRERYDIAVARAVARTAVLAEYLLPLVRIGGRMISMKGADPADEVRETAFGEFGGRLENVTAIDVPFVDGARHLIVARKSEPTPDQYPRRTGVPAKRPRLAEP